MSFSTLNKGTAKPDREGWRYHCLQLRWGATTSGRHMLGFRGCGQTGPSLVEGLLQSPSCYCPRGCRQTGSNQLGLKSFWRKRMNTGWIQLKVISSGESLFCKGFPYAEQKRRALLLCVETNLLGHGQFSNFINTESTQIKREWNGKTPCQCTDAGRTVVEFWLLVKRNKSKIADSFQLRDY